jgi:hypothetical protein
LGVGALVDRAATGYPQIAQRFDAAVTLFGGTGPFAGQGGLGRLDGVDRVGLALEPAGLAVRTVDLDHLDAFTAQPAGEPCSVGAGPLDPDPQQPPEPAHPGQQGGVSGYRGGELLGAQHSPDQVDHRRGVRVLMGVDSTGDLDDCGFFRCNRGHRRPVARDWGRAARTSRATRTRQRWGLWPGSY